MRDSRQNTGKILLVLLVLAGMASIVRCSSTITPIPTTEEPASTHLGLAYYSERDGIDNQGALYLLDLESGEEQRLTGKDEVITLNSGFSWSPVARKFVYAAGLMREAEIYIVDVTGQHRQRLTHNVLEESFPSWSPDASQIAFLGRGILGESEDTALRAYVMNADGSGQRLLIDNPDVLSVGSYWSPNGKRMALLVANLQVAPRKPPMYDILVIDIVTGKEVLRVADGSDHLFLAWAHDGQRLAFVSNQEGKYELYTVEVDNGRQTKIAEVPRVITAEWSPDDQLLSFSAGPESIYDVYVVQGDGHGLINLTNDQVYDVGSRWSPDGQKITFSSAEFEEGKDFESAIEIYILEVNTGVINQITHNQFPDGPPSWVAW